MHPIYLYTLYFASCTTTLLLRATEKPAFMQLWGKAAEKPAFLLLLRSFYAELRKNSHDEQKLQKRNNYTGASTPGVYEAFACSFYAGLHKTCVSAEKLCL